MPCTVGVYFGRRTVDMFEPILLLFDIDVFFECLLMCEYFLIELFFEVVVGVLECVDLLVEDLVLFFEMVSLFLDVLELEVEGLFEEVGLFVVLGGEGDWVVEFVQFAEGGVDLDLLLF